MQVHACPRQVTAAKDIAVFDGIDGRFLVKAIGP